MEKIEILEKAQNNLKEYCNFHNIEINNDILEKLNTYYNLLIEWNEKINLTAITELEDVYLKHFADSVSSIPQIRQNATVCDIGTGAGFPGLVIAIFRPDLKITLVDSLNKRINFLNLVIDSLKLKNVTTLHYRAEDIDFKLGFLNSFDYVVSRAVATLNTLVEYCLPYVKTNGTFIAYKTETAQNEIKESINAIRVLGGNTKVETIDYNLLDFNRVLVLISKVSKTSDKYPRNQNKPRLKPLK